MTSTIPNSAGRRHFLRSAGALSTLGAATPLALNLAGIGAAAAQTAPTDYRALVCVFLFGGNDHYNTVLPFDTADFAAYQAARAGIARNAADCTSLGAVASQGGRTLALPNELSPLAGLFTQRKAAILANVGPLVVPLTKAQYQAGSAPIPPKLFSHNDQQSVWQSSGAEGATIGWGGRFGDLLASNNGNTLFTAIGLSGNTVFLSGQTVSQYQVGSSGPVTISGLSGNPFGSNLAAATLRTLITATSPQLFENELSRVNLRSIDANEALATALAASTPPATVFDPANPLAVQLQMVARIIAARSALGAKRQVFFVSLGGFDTHDNQLTTQPDLHTQLAAAIASFHQATIDMQVESNVTTFTASDFGRTLTSNGDGSDHGWGSHHFVIGGAVRGGDVYGQFPTVALGTAEDLGSGRLLPSTAVVQYAATLATWFGVPTTQLADALPYIGSFSQSDLGFMTAL
jgi:uncharacterized protein (DUF1501 family)